jgi:hypothetical protein
MKAAIATTTAINQGFTFGRHGILPGGGIRGVAAVPPELSNSALMKPSHSLDRTLGRPLGIEQLGWLIALSYECCESAEPRISYTLKLHYHRRIRRDQITSSAHLQKEIRPG